MAVQDRNDVLQSPPMAPSLPARSGAAQTPVAAFRFRAGTGAVRMATGVSAWSALGSLLHELRRRRVVQVALAYAALALVIVQVGDTSAPTTQV